MERKTTNQVANKPQPPKWKKLPGTGKHKMPDGRILTGTETFRAWPDELKGVRDKFQSLEEVEPQQPEPIATLIPKARPDGLYDVVNSATQRPINSKPLEQRAAFDLINGKLDDPEEVEQEEVVENGEAGEDEEEFDEEESL